MDKLPRKKGFKRTTIGKIWEERRKESMDKKITHFAGLPVDDFLTKKEEIIELLMELPFKQCTCNNPTIICEMCKIITLIREYIEKNEKL